MGIINYLKKDWHNSIDPLMHDVETIKEIKFWKLEFWKSLIGSIFVGVGGLLWVLAIIAFWITIFVIIFAIIKWSYQLIF